MTENKLVIHKKISGEDASVGSVRLPKSLIKKLDDIARRTGRTRNDIIQTCLEHSVNNLVIEE